MRMRHHTHTGIVYANAVKFVILFVENLKNGNVPNLDITVANGNPTHRFLTSTYLLRQIKLTANALSSYNVLIAYVGSTCLFRGVIISS